MNRLTKLNTTSFSRQLFASQRMVFSPMRTYCTESSVLKGNVKWFDERKGFGFITPTDGSGDIVSLISYFH